MVLACKGVKVEYCEAAEFFDEQPRDFKTVLRQRIRWAKGRLTAFFRYGFKTFTSIFKHKSFTSYDLFCFYFPYGLFTWIIGLIYPFGALIYGSINGTYNYRHMLLNVAATFASMYFSCLFAGIYTAVREWRHIHCGALKIVYYVILYPWYSLISVYVYLAAIFMDVKWLPIIHSDSRRIEDLMREPLPGIPQGDTGIPAGETNTK
jgi:cellulose synthase/poly-beta-1,6-N-acetylglucosamine synthase-like glycosyltransferase